MSDSTYDDSTSAESTTNNPASASYSSAIFSGSQHFTVAGGTFNVTNNYTAAPDTPSNFRTIPLGDIDLQHEIRWDDVSSVRKRALLRRAFSLEPEVYSRVRRVYSAKVGSPKSSVTVAMYQGSGAEESWREDILQQSRLRHPNFVQLWGVMSSSGIHAAVFHDDLIPLEHFLDLYRDSPILTTYIKAYCAQDRGEAHEYLSSTLKSANERLQYRDIECTFWIRRSTGDLCVDLAPGIISGVLRYVHSRPQLKFQRITSPDVAKEEAMIIDSLTLEEFYAINFEREQRWISSVIPVTVGAVISCSSIAPAQDTDSGLDRTRVLMSHLADPMEPKLLNIATLPDVDTYPDEWYGSKGQEEVMQNGWTRYTSDKFGNSDDSDVSDEFYYTVPNTFEISWFPAWKREFWASQAIHILARLQTLANVEDYFFVDSIDFEIDISDSAENPPPGFLFLCPVKEFQSEPGSFRWPDCSAYWSLDPSGVERLSTEDAAIMGFPSLTASLHIWGKAWDSTNYLALLHFYQAKGFDPCSQEVALHLGHPLFQITAPIKDCDDTDSLAEDDQSPGAEEENFEEMPQSSSCQDDQDPSPTVDRDQEHAEVPVSLAFKCVMRVQLTLISFLALFGLYEKVWPR